MRSATRRMSDADGLSEESSVGLGFTSPRCQPLDELAHAERGWRDARAWRSMHDHVRSCCHFLDLVVMLEDDLIAQVWPNAAVERHAGR